MSAIETNRDLYLAIAELTATQRSGGRDLEEYLRALWDGARRLSDRASLSADEFFGLLAAAFTSPAPAFEEAWRSRFAEHDPGAVADCLASKMGLEQPSTAEDRTDPTGFAAWGSTVLRQIVDLREMAEHGTLEDPYRWFGIDSPPAPWQRPRPSLSRRLSRCGRLPARVFCRTPRPWYN